jgi:hypothetical protein
MSALILRSINHLYKIFKVYLSLAFFGASAVIGYGLVVSKPLVVLISFISIGLLLTVIVLWYQTRTLSIDKNVEEKTKPPKVPESLMALMLPTKVAEPILADLRVEFIHLVSKYGRKSAAIWHVVQSMNILVHVVILHFGSGVAKRFIDSLVRKSS